VADHCRTAATEEQAQVHHRVKAFSLDQLVTVAVVAVLAACLRRLGPERLALHQISIAAMAAAVVVRAAYSALAGLRAAALRVG
jgi:hypothetical protein